MSTKNAVSRVKVKPAGNAAPRNAVPAVQRAVQILDALAGRREPQALADLTKHLALPKSSVLGLCNTLTAAGLLSRHADGRYGLGVHLVDLAHAYLANVDLTREFTTLWESLQILPREGMVLAVLDGTDVVYVACRNGERPLGVAYRIGMRLPAHCTATGKALLSTLPEAEVRGRYRGRRLERLTAKSATSIRALLDDLGMIRRRGYAIDDEETREGMMCIGAPIFDVAGPQAVAAVAVSMLKYPEDADKLKQAAEGVGRFALALSQRMGAGIE